MEAFERQLFGYSVKAVHREITTLNGLLEQNKAMIKKLEQEKRQLSFEIMELKTELAVQKEIVASRQKR